METKFKLAEAVKEIFGLHKQLKEGRGELWMWTSLDLILSISLVLSAN